MAIILAGPVQSQVWLDNPDGDEQGETSIWYGSELNNIGMGCWPGQPGLVFAAMKFGPLPTGYELTDIVFHVGGNSYPMPVQSGGLSMAETAIIAMSTVGLRRFGFAGQDKMLDDLVAGSDLEVMLVSPGEGMADIPLISVPASPNDPKLVALRAACGAAAGAGASGGDASTTASAEAWSIGPSPYRSDKLSARALDRNGRLQLAVACAEQGIMGLSVYLTGIPVASDVQFTGRVAIDGREFQTKWYGTPIGWGVHAMTEEFVKAALVGNEMIIWGGEGTPFYISLSGSSQAWRQTLAFCMPF